MKKGLRKLILSGTALAAVAATLGTSTYAWYTTNETVNANNIAGQAQAAGDSSIFISLNGVDFSQKVDLSVGEGKTYGTYALLDAANGSNFASAQLMPAQSLSNAFKKLDGTTTSSDNDILSFYLYFKTAATSADVPVYISNISVVNNAQALTSFYTDNLLNGTTAAQNAPAVGVNRNQSKYAVDITKALALKTSTTEDDYAVKTASGSKAAATNYWDLQGNISSALADYNVTNAAGMAVNYYNEVMNANIAKPEQNLNDPTAANTTLGSRDRVCTLDKEGGVCAVRFDVYLNGWDDYCFDACKGQAFTLQLEFTSKNSN